MKIKVHPQSFKISLLNSPQSGLQLLTAEPARQGCSPSSTSFPAQMQIQMCRTRSVCGTHWGDVGCGACSPGLESWETFANLRAPEAASVMAVIMPLCKNLN